MQLDETRIAVRERSLLDTLDLALHVLRAYLKPLLITFSLGVLPMMALNHFLLGWIMAGVEYREGFSSDDFGQITRYVWNMSLLVLIEAPLASVFATAYLGQAVFLEQPSVGQIVREVREMFGRLAWCQLLVRGVVPAWLLLWSIDRYAGYSPQEAFLMPLAAYVVLVRALRPFMNEIIVLERNPLRGRTRMTMTIGKRSALLHSPSGSDLFLRWFGAASVGFLLLLAIYGNFVFASGVFLNDWTPGPLMIQLGLPLSMWLVALYFTVFRFLSYLDLRIRHEGWEVELQLRAEAARLSSSLS